MERGSHLSCCCHSEQQAGLSDGYRLRWQPRTGCRWSRLPSSPTTATFGKRRLGVLAGTLRGQPSLPSANGATFSPCWTSETSSRPLVVRPDGRPLRRTLVGGNDAAETAGALPQSDANVPLGRQRPACRGDADQARPSREAGNGRRRAVVGRSTRAVAARPPLASQRHPRHQKQPLVVPRPRPAQAPPISGSTRWRL